MVLKLKNVEGRGYEINITDEIQKKHKKEPKEVAGDEEMEETEDNPVHLVSTVNNILHFLQC